jgi:hypothetical protein
MIYDPAWEKFKNGNGIRKRSLLDVIQKLKPKNGFKKQNQEKIKNE